MSDWQPWQPEFDDEDENGEQLDEMQTSEKDSLLILIDCRKKMFQPILPSSANNKDQGKKIKEEPTDEPSLSSGADLSDTNMRSSNAALVDQGNKDEKKEIPFLNSLLTAARTYADKIISSDTDLIGLCFFGTREKNNPYDFNNIFLYHDMDVPDSQRIKDLDKLIADYKNFDQKYGHMDDDADFKFSEVLWLVSHLFAHVPKNVGFKRVLLFTNDDDPVRGDANERKKCIEKSKDLIESDITTELLVVSKQGEFNPNLFWSQVISVEEDEYTGRIIFDFAERYKELQEKVRRKEFKKRSVGTVPLSIGDGTNSALVSLNVKMYNLIMKAKKPSHIWLHADTNRRLKTETKWICGDTGTELMNGDIKRWIEYGGERVIFEPDELKMMMKKFDEPGLKILGFKPKNRLKVYHNIQHSTFIYPDDTSVKGSATAFSALHKKMIEMDKIAICRFIARNNAAPKFVAMLPQEEILDQDGGQVEPPGFHLIYLPFADDIRNLQIEQSGTAEDEQKLKAKQIIKKFHIAFDSNNFENPALQQHFTNIHALALDRHVGEEKHEDVLVPDTEGMLKYKNLIESFKQSAFPNGYRDPDAGSSSSRSRGGATFKKRKAEGDDGDATAEVKEEEGTTTKKKSRRGDVKEEDAEEGVAAGGGGGGGIDLVSLAKDDNLNSLKLPELKEYLKANKLPVSGTKATLIERIMDHMKKKQLI